ncbi:hypothetical protein ACIBCU_04950 [Streptomyces sp. NPDC051064]
MTRDGELATRDYLALVLSGISKETDMAAKAERRAAPADVGVPGG